MLQHAINKKFIQIQQNFTKNFSLLETEIHIKMLLQNLITFDNMFVMNK